MVEESAQKSCGFEKPNFTQSVDFGNEKRPARESGAPDSSLVFWLAFRLQFLKEWYRFMCAGEVPYLNCSFVPSASVFHLLFGARNAYRHRLVKRLRYLGSLVKDGNVVHRPKLTANVPASSARMVERQSETASKFQRDRVFHGIPR